MPHASPTPDPGAALAREALGRPRSPYRELPERLVLVDVARQCLELIEGGRVVRGYPVSTAAAGVGGEDGSLRTPPGWHRIHQRIGDGARAGAGRPAAPGCIVMANADVIALFGRVADGEPVVIVDPEAQAIPDPRA